MVDLGTVYLSRFPWFPVLLAVSAVDGAAVSSLLSHVPRFGPGQSESIVDQLRLLGKHLGGGTNPPRRNDRTPRD